MNVKTSLLALALGVALSGSASAATISAGEAQDLMVGAGLTEISSLELRNDTWLATARNRDGALVAVSVNPDTREVTWTRNGDRTVTTTTTTTTSREPVRIARADEPVVVEEVVEPPVVRVPVVVEKRVLVPAGGRISKNDVRPVLASAGYHHIHDIDWSRRHGAWKAEAREPSGNEVEVRVDPVDGRILHVEDD